ncbi:MAG: hypothetical protein U0L18_03620 [Acutalibacteraceae bacterium]|nr:hypothetical protein [Acutalibacteraceae bacterium]
MRSFEGEKRIDISEFPSPSAKKAKHFHQRSVKVGCMVKLKWLL